MVRVLGRRARPPLACAAPVLAQGARRDSRSCSAFRARSMQCCGFGLSRQHAATTPVSRSRTLPTPNNALGSREAAARRAVLAGGARADPGGRLRGARRVAPEPRAHGRLPQVRAAHLRAVPAQRRRRRPALETAGALALPVYLLLVFGRAGQESEIPNFKGSYLGRFPLDLTDFWTSDHLSERSRSMDAFSGTRARGTLKLKRT